MGNRLTFVLVALAVCMGALTYTGMTAHSPLSGDANKLILLLNIDLVVLLALVVAIVRRVVALWSGGRRGVAGSALQVKLVGLFSMLVAFPAIITTVFSVGLFYYGIHGWFDTRVRTAVDESLAVARAYLNEHTQVIKADITAMSADLNREAYMLSISPKALEKMINTQSMLRNFSETIVFDADHRVLAQSGIALSMMFDPIPDALMDQARAGNVVIDTTDDDRIRALVRLTGFGDETYLYVGRSVDPQVLTHLDTTRAAVTQYQELASKSGRIQLTITIMYVVVVLLLMAIAVWFGLALARRMVEPIGALITASERLRAGDMTARVSEAKGLQEFEILGRAFNRMSAEIERQRNELIEANKSIDYRRRFTETVLGGVSTGIMGVNEAGIITLANPAAGNLLGTSNEKLVGQALTDVLPGAEIGRRGEHEISAMRRDGAPRTFLLRASTELVGEAGQGTILAFDDITDLITAQKSAAWADVARRIAHEIKNPLTPIQLSAERIKRKYLETMADEKEREVLEKCTDTIVRHVDDIKNMVNAFADFAKMPDPVMAQVNLADLVDEVLNFQSAANVGVKFELIRDPAGDWTVRADQQLIRQALTNLVQNAVDAVESQPVRQIALVLRRDKGLWLGVLDNGPGVPANRRSAVLEPYVTTKSKGTGLGLAIVKKIIEDHDGKIAMDDPAPMPETYGGAHFWLYIPEQA